MEALQHVQITEHSIPFFPGMNNNLKPDIPVFSALPPLILADDTPQSEEGLRVSEEDYWKHYYEHPDFRYEWNDGVLEVKAMGDFASYLLADWFIEIIKENIKTFKQARLIGLDIGFKLNLPDKKASIRKPDLAVILASNPVQIEPDDRTYKGCFDIYIEFLSDSDKKVVEKDTVIKRLEYCQVGVKEYFILDRKNKETAFYRLNSKGKYVKIVPRNGIIQSKVLPNFQFRVKDLYAQPLLEDLIKDDVYKSYVLTNYQEQCKRADMADHEYQKAETERQKAVADRQKVETELQKAKNMLEMEHQRAEEERQKAKNMLEMEHQRAEEERQKAVKAEKKAKKLAEKLQAILKESGQATAL
ncbi:MAG: Uma2 family endonuclease [Candidatus Magnetomorum sp.]|nr:Uma2 family endonuclease [Candidatus Magnetomorum sp.]